MDSKWAALLNRAAGAGDLAKQQLDEDGIAETGKLGEVDVFEAQSALSEWIRETLDGKLPRPKAAFQDRLDRKHAKGALVKIKHFLPQQVAEGAFLALKSDPKASWSSATTETDTGREEDGAGTAKHSYNVGDGGNTGSDSRNFVEAITKLIESLIPGLHGSFQAGCYRAGDFIEPHDDTAYKMINGKLHRRHIAFIYYLTKDWQEDFGGNFIDLDTGTLHVPIFNSAVSFYVPRLHQVETHRLVIDLTYICTALTLLHFTLVPPYHPANNRWSSCGQTNHGSPYSGGFMSRVTQRMLMESPMWMEILQV